MNKGQYNKIEEHNIGAQQTVLHNNNLGLILAVNLLDLGAKFDGKKEEIVVDGETISRNIKGSIEFLKEFDSNTALYLIGVLETSHLSRLIQGLDYDKITRLTRLGRIKNLKRYIEKKKTYFNIDKSWEILEARVIKLPKSLIKKWGKTPPKYRILLKLKIGDNKISAPIGYPTKHVKYSYNKKSILHCEKFGNPFSKRGFSINSYIIKEEIKNWIKEAHHSGIKVIENCAFWDSPEILTEENYKYYGHKVHDNTERDKQILKEHNYGGVILYLRSGKKVFVGWKDGVFQDMLHPDLCAKTGGGEYYWEKAYLEHLKQHIDNFDFDGFRVDLAFTLYTPLYLFSWNDVHGNDKKRLIDHLEKSLKINWVKNAEIKKIDDDTITVKNVKNSLTIKLNKEEKNVIFKTNDGNSYEYILEEENGKLKIYDYDYSRIKKVFFEAIDYASEQKDKKIYFVLEVYKCNQRDIFRSWNKEKGYPAFKTYYKDVMDNIFDKKHSYVSKSLNWVIDNSEAAETEVIFPSNFDEMSLKDMVESDKHRHNLIKMFILLANADYNVLFYLRDLLEFKGDVIPIPGGKKDKPTNKYITHKFVTHAELEKRLKKSLPEIFKKSFAYKMIRESKDIEGVKVNDEKLAVFLKGRKKLEFDLKHLIPHKSYRRGYIGKNKFSNSTNIK